MKALHKLKLIFPFILMTIIGITVGSLISLYWSNAPQKNIKPGDYSHYFPDEQTELIMLGTTWCPICAKARAFLQAEDVNYLEYDVDESVAGKTLVEELGETGIVPIILLRDRLLRGFNPEDLKKWLNPPQSP